ncbi:MAG: putative lipid II flippase FtsW [Bdellovibrionota bacterium]
MAKKATAHHSKSQSGESCPWPLPAEGIDLVLVGIVAAMILFGLLMVYSSSFIFAQERAGDGFAFIRKQVFFALAGISILLVTCRINYQKWATFAYPILGLAMTLLVCTLIPGLGSKIGGAQRWIKFGNIGFQPGEFAKFAVIFFVAAQLNRKRERIHTLTAGILSHILLPLPCLILLLMQPDFGTAVMIMIVVFALMYLAGVPGRLLLAAFALAASAGLWLAMGTEYRRNRMMTYLDPWRDPSGKGFQILQSLVGLHNGRVWGVGLGNGKEKLFYLPEAHNDFIFAVIGEELGFLGAISVILAYVFFIYRGLRIAWNSQTRFGDSFGYLLAAGITLAIGLQGFINMAVVLGILPTKGLTLPFISYGGSALLADLFAVGVLLSIARGPRVGFFSIAS